MRVKCANCGMIYEINPSPMEFRTPLERFLSGQCPKCKSNAKDRVEKVTWIEEEEK